MANKGELKERKKYIYEEESWILIGIAMQLHRELRCGFKEKVYQDAFEILLKEKGIPYEREKRATVTFHNTVLEHGFYYDFLCFGKIVVELKADSEIKGEYEAQIINYINIGGYKLGILLNFGTLSLQHRFYPNKQLTRDCQTIPDN